MAGAFDHRLHVVLPGHLGQLAQGVQFGELRFVVGVRCAAGAQTIAQAEKDTSYAFMMSQMSSKCVYRKLSRWCAMHHLAMMEPPRETMPVRRCAVRWM